MANDFLSITKRALQRHGKTADYIRTTASVYNVETGKAVKTTSTTSVLMYKRHVKTNQYNYPSLIGKEVAEFYIAFDSLATAPKITDRIVFDGENFTVDSYQEHMAQGQIVLYKVLGVRG